jgi:hypothetical protein
VDFDSTPHYANLKNIFYRGELMAIIINRVYCKIEVDLQYFYKEYHCNRTISGHGREASSS